MISLLQDAGAVLGQIAGAIFRSRLVRLMATLAAVAAIDALFLRWTLTTFTLAAVLVIVFFSAIILMIVVFLAIVCWPISVPLIVWQVRQSVWLPLRTREILRSKGYSWARMRDARLLVSCAKRLPPRDDVALTPGYCDTAEQLIRFGDMLARQRAPEPPPASPNTIWNAPVERAQNSRGSRRGSAPGGEEIAF